MTGFALIGTHLLSGFGAKSRANTSRHGFTLVACTAVSLCGATACVGGDAPDDAFDTNQGAAIGGSGGSGGSSGSKTSAAGSGGTGGTGGQASATGSGGSSSTKTIQAGSKDSHYPLVDGATWTYEHKYPQNPGKAAWDEVAIMHATTYMDAPAFLLEDEEDAQGEKSSSTLVTEGSQVLRVLKQVSVAGQNAFKTTYDPGFLRYDESWQSSDAVSKLTYMSEQTCIVSSTASKCAAGAMLAETTTHAYKVLSLHSEITVPAGTFDTVEIERTNEGDPAVTGDEDVKRFWFAAGVGKVREEDMDNGATEELKSYDVP